MRRIALAAVAVFMVLAWTMTATAAQTPTPGDSIQAPPTPPTCLAQSFKGFSRAAWDIHRWRRGAPDGRTIAEQRRRLGCAPSTSHRKAMKAEWQRDKAAFYVEVHYRHTAPFPGYSGQGYFLRYLAVPRWIVDCETNGLYGQEKWDALNSSGAGGPAQLLGHGQPQPAETAAERILYWKITADLYASSGTSPWAQCGG